MSVNNEQPDAAARGADTYAAYVLKRIRDALEGLRFGEISVIVQDGVVVQVERTEKVRLRHKDP